VEQTYNVLLSFVSPKNDAENFISFRRAKTDDDAIKLALMDLAGEIKRGYILKASGAYLVPDNICPSNSPDEVLLARNLDDQKPQYLFFNLEKNPSKDLEQDLAAILIKYFPTLRL